MVQTSVTACECPQGCPTQFCTFLHHFWTIWSGYEIMVLLDVLLLYCCWWHLVRGLGLGYSQSLVEVPTLNLEFWLFTHNSLVFNNSHWYQYQAIGNLHVDYVGTWRCVWDSQTQNKHFIPL